MRESVFGDGGNWMPDWKKPVNPIGMPDWKEPSNPHTAQASQAIFFIQTKKMDTNIFFKGKALCKP